MFNRKRDDRHIKYNENERVSLDHNAMQVKDNLYHKFSTKDNNKMDKPVIL